MVRTSGPAAAQVEVAPVVVGQVYRFLSERAAVATPAVALD